MARAQTQHWINRTLRMAKVRLPPHWHANAEGTDISSKPSRVRPTVVPFTCRGKEITHPSCPAHKSPPPMGGRRIRLPGKRGVSLIIPLHARVKVGGGEAVAERQRRVQERSTGSPLQVRSPRPEVPCPSPSQTHPNAQTPVGGCEVHGSVGDGWRGGWVGGSRGRCAYLPVLPLVPALSAGLVGLGQIPTARTTQGEGEVRMKVGDNRRALVPATTKGGGRLLTWTWGRVGWV